MNAKGKRWLDVVLVYSTAGLVLWVLYSIARSGVVEPIEWFDQQPLLTRLPVISLISSFLWLFIHNTGGIRLINDIKSFPRYPSIWVVSIFIAFAAFMILLILHLGPLGDFATALQNLMIFILSCGLVVGICNLLKTNMENPIPQGNQNDRIDKLDSAEKIIKWSERETAILRKETDLFDYKYIADKLSDILSSGYNKNIAIIGHYGSGKSSVINLIKAKGIKKTFFVQVDGWGFKEGTAIEHVLQLVIEDLKRELDCLAINNLPKQYHNAMSSSGNNILTILGCCMGGTRNPVKVLKRIDSMLECQNRRLIIVLEDFDRNINETTFYNEIASFLNTTTELHRTSFIIAIGPTEKASAVLSKLCEHCEYILSLDQNELTDIYHNLIEALYSRFSDDEQVDSYERIVNCFRMPKRKTEQRLYIASGYKKPLDFVRKLIETPRALKASRWCNIVSVICC